MEENLIPLLLLCAANLALNTANFVLLLRARKARRDVSEKLDKVLRSVMNYTVHTGEALHRLMEVDVNGRRRYDR